MHGSDHFPIVIKEKESDPEKHHPRWNLNKANLEKFSLLCEETISPELFKTANDIEIFTNSLIDIAEKCIPKTSTNYKRNKPWFNDKVKTAIKKRKSALRTFNKNPTKENLIYTKEMRAKQSKLPKEHPGSNMSLN